MLVVILISFYKKIEGTILVSRQMTNEFQKRIESLKLDSQTKKIEDSMGN